MFPNKPFYVLSGYSPKSEGLLGSSFGIGLDVNSARLFYSKLLTDESFNRLERIGLEIIKNHFPKIDRSHLEIYDLLDNKEDNRTWLLHHLIIPGNAAGMSIDDNYESNFRNSEGLIEYFINNIDYISQASCALSLWLEWARVACAATI